MKKLILLVIMLAVLFLTASCGSRPKPKIYGGLDIRGINFEVTQAPLLKNSVEASLVEIDDAVVYLPSIGMLSGNLSRGLTPPVTIDSNVKFNYVMKHNNQFYNLYQGTDGIHIKHSMELISSWSHWNDGQPIVPLGTGDYANLWNPSAIVDSTGLWHLLIECGASSDQSDVGLCYLTGNLVDGMFTLAEDFGRVIDGAGNAFLGMDSSGQIFSIYGKIDLTSGRTWYVGGAVLDGTSWTESEDFKISAQGIHVCDPHLVETSSGVTMVLSYDQDSIYELKVESTFDEIVTKLRN